MQTAFSWASLRTFSQVEIGGDTQSTEATEASHMHTADDGGLDCEACYNRGYEFWLLKQASLTHPIQPPCCCFLVGCHSGNPVFGIRTS